MKKSRFQNLSIYLNLLLICALITLIGCSEKKSNNLLSDLDNKSFKLSYFANTGFEDKYIYFIGGTHGDEPESVYVSRKLLAILQNNRFYNKSVVVIPVLNEIGYIKKTRINQYGVDLNRNLPTKNWEPFFTQPRYNPGPKPLSEDENIYLLHLFEKYPPKFIVSFHSIDKGAMLVYNKHAKEITEFVGKHVPYPIPNHIGYKTPGSLANYGDDNKIPVLTYQLPPAALVAIGQTWHDNKEALIELVKQH